MIEVGRLGSVACEVRRDTVRAMNRSPNGVPAVSRAANLPSLPSAAASSPPTRPATRSRAFLEYSRGVHQAVNGGVERLRGCLRVALDDLEESLTERPALATTREAIAARDLLRSTLRAAYQAG